MNHYIHNINPIILEIAGPLAIRWYGISYLLSFVAAILLLRHWSKKGEFDVPEKQVSDFVVTLAFFGVFLGGRIGHTLLYAFDQFLADPLSLVRIWDGGMSSHGGMLGVAIFMLWYARKHKCSFWNLADNMACTASLGFAFGRIANFINGELWGRVTNVKWGMIFPQATDPTWKYGNYTVEQIRSLNLEARHPSQLYQAFAEGFLVFGIMLILRRLPIAKRSGFLSASYFILYAIARIVVEFYREPDTGHPLIFGLTKGQIYSIAMIIGAAIVLWKINRSAEKVADRN